MANPQAILFADWEPDKSDRVNPEAEAKGVFSVAGQYAPFPDLQDYGPDPTIDSNTTVLLHMDGADATTSFPDDGTAAAVWTAVGNAQVDIVQSKFGGASALFDGTGDRLTTPDNAAIVFPGDFTVDGWFNCNAAVGTERAIMGSSVTPYGAAQTVFWVRLTTTGQLQLAASNGVAFPSCDGVTTFSSTVNTGWHHFACTRSGSTCRLFIDGLQEGTFTLSGALANTANGWAVGDLDATNQVNPWIGWIDELRISVGIDRYSAADVPDSFTRILLHMNGADASTLFPDHALPHTWTAAGNAQVDTAQSKFGGASLLCDGTGDWISAPDSADFTLGGGDWTVDLWFNCTAAGGTTQRLAGQNDNAGTVTTRSFFIVRQVGNVIQASAAVGGVQTNVVGTTQFTDVLNPGWHHLAFVRTGNILRLFFDGVQEGGDVSISGTVNDSTNALAIGTNGEQTTNTWTGWIDEFRLSVGVARYTAAFTPPTAAFSQGFAASLPTTAYNFGGGAEDVVLGADTFYDSTTDPHIFFGDATRLYTLVNREAEDVSKAGGYTVGSSDTWQFAQFGDHVVAVSKTEAPQKYTMLSSVDFANLPGSPPSGATSVARVSDFLWLGKDFTVYWSAFNDIDDWVPDTVTQAGNQELDQERGEIMALVGLDYAAIFQERGIRRAIYVGAPVIWDFGQDYVEKARGTISHNSVVPWGRLIFYAADDGFYVFDGQSSTPIGYGKVDSYYTRNLNYAFRHKISCGIDYSRKLVVWAFPAGSAQLPTELLMFAIQDGRWTHDVIDTEFVFDTPAEPFTVDNFSTLYPVNDLDTDTIIPDDIDSAAFDDRRIRLAAFRQTTHQLGLFTGANRAATMDTKEFEPAPGQRALLTEVWPLGDYQTGEVASSVRYRRALPGATVMDTNPAQMNRAGYCPQRIDARFMRIRQQITAGAVWRRAEGIHFTATPTGRR